MPSAHIILHLNDISFDAIVAGILWEHHRIDAKRIADLQHLAANRLQFSGQEEATGNPFYVTATSWAAYGTRDFFVIDRNTDALRATLNNPQSVQKMSDRFCGNVQASFTF